MEGYESQDIIVSVLVLTYNHKNYISKALEGILAQVTNFDVEILVGDDASTDGTSDVVRQYAQRNPQKIFPFIRVHNQGATKNLRDLLERARGIYINGCEGDDYWTDPHKLQKQVDYMVQHPQCSGCVHAFTIVDEHDVPLRNQYLRWICNKRIYSLRDFKGLFLPSHPVTFLHKNIFKDAPEACELIERAHPQVADRTIAMLVAAEGEIHRLNDNMACYRKVLGKDKGNVTSREFAFKADSKLTEYRMNDILEAYMRKEKGVCVNFNWFRRDLLIRAGAKAVLRPSGENLRCFCEILKEWSRTKCSSLNEVCK